MRDNNCPCNGCTEREIACSDRCKKDARGEYGHKAWLADYRKREAEIKERKREIRKPFSAANSVSIRGCGRWI